MRILLWVFCLLGALEGWGQTIQWQDQVGHPRRNNDGSFSYEDYSNGIAAFEDRLAVCFYGYAYGDLNQTSHIHRQVFLRYYDYRGNLLNEDTIGGMASDGRISKLTDSTFLVRVNYTYLNPLEIIYDTGQIGGYMLREYTKSGRLLWQKRQRVNTRSRCFDIYPRPGHGHTFISHVNMDNQGIDSTFFEFYDLHGNLERQAFFPQTFGTGLFGVSANPERYLATQAKPLGSSGPWLYTVMHFDSSMRVRREDTIGISQISFGNISITNSIGGKYSVILPSNSDTIRTRFAFFDETGRLERIQIIDSGSADFISLADGGALTTEIKFLTNSFQQLSTLMQSHLPYTRSYYFRRLDVSWQPIWTVNVTDWLTDSIYFRYTPAVPVPSSSSDAIFFGRRVISPSVHSEPWGTFALVGRINGVGQIFDPTATRPQAGPRADGLAVQLFPNPTTSAIHIDTDYELAYRLVAATGQVVQTGRARRGLPISMYGLAPGLYQVVLGDGVRSVVKRVVKL